MIPKIIHYCWFGKKEKPQKIKDCINSWYQTLPDYQIIEWNENNFDYNDLTYTRGAYEAKKYAFVSDVARVKALYEMGGIYLDTDVMVYKSFNEILNKPCVLGFEMGNYVATSFMACEPEFKLMKEFYNLYKDLPFYDEKGRIISGTNVTKLTNILEKKGLIRNNQYQEIRNEIYVYPDTYFSPYNYAWEYSNKNNNTICEHLFFVSWLPWSVRLKKITKRTLTKIIRRIYKSKKKL